jgi:exosortase
MKTEQALTSMHLSRRDLGFGLFIILTGLVTHGLLNDLIHSGYHGLSYAHVPMVPLVSIYVIYSERKAIFSNVNYAFAPGALVLAIGLLLYWGGMVYKTDLGPNDHLTGVTLSIVIWYIGGFILFYGERAFRNAVFPLFFLLFAVPIPQIAMEKIIPFLQRGSVEVVHLLLTLTGVPFSREGFVLHLPGLSVEVAEECSGIRSTVGLFLPVVAAAHLMLKTGWKKAVLVASVIPIAIFKNAIRIVTISLLAAYVDKEYLTHSFLHRSGGIVFYLPALFLLGLILWRLRRWEKE